MGFGVVHDVGVVHHLGQLLVVEGFAQLAGDALEAVEVSEAVALLVPDLEDASQTVAGFGVADLGADDLEELIELDGPVDRAQAVDHLEYDLASALEPELLEDLLDFDGVYGSSVVIVEQVEGVLELFVIALAESVLPGGLGCHFGGRSTLHARRCRRCNCGFASFHINKILRYY